MNDVERIPILQTLAQQRDYLPISPYCNTHTVTAHNLTGDVGL